MVGRGAFMLVGALSVSCYINALSHTHLATARRAHAGSRVRSSRLPSRAAPTMARDDEQEEADGDEGDDLQIMIWISDPKTETPIRCYMESSTEVDGSLYALAHPVDIPVIIATCEDEEKGLNGIEDDAAIDAVFDIAKEVLREEGFELKRTPFMLTVEEDEEAFDLDDISGEGEGEMGAYAEDEEDEDEMDVDDLEEGAEVSRATRRALPARCRARARSPTSAAPAVCWNCAARDVGGVGQILPRRPAVLRRRAARADLHRRAATIGHALHAARRERAREGEADARAELHRAQRSVCRRRGLGRMSARARGRDAARRQFRPHQ